MFIFPLAGINNSLKIVNKCIQWSLAEPEKLKFWRRSKVKGWVKKVTRYAMAEKLSAWVVQQVIESPLPICFLFFKLFGGGMDYKTGIWMLQRLLVRLVTAWGRAFAGFLIWWCWWWVLYAIPAISGKMQRTLRGLRGRNNCIGRQYWFKLRRDLEAVSGWGVKGLLW